MLSSISSTSTTSTSTTSTTDMVPEAVRTKVSSSVFDEEFPCLCQVGELPDLSSLDKEALAVLVEQLYSRSCATFTEAFDQERVVKKHAIEINDLELEVNDMHGKFIVPKLKKVGAIDNFIEVTPYLQVNVFKVVETEH